jgi:hypothetical protein
MGCCASTTAGRNDQLPAGRVLDVSVSYCLDSDNTRVLFDDVVFGENLCVLIF